MTKRILKRWECEYRKAATADRLAVCRDHLHSLGLPDEPEMLLNGTILVVHACCAYASLDGQPVDRFLELQKYHAADAPDSKYSFTFDLWGHAFARVLVSAKKEVLDLADLYGHPWWEYQVCGYRCFWVSRTDGDYLSTEEMAQIQAEVTDDLRFDYPDDELEFWFDDSVVEGSLQVNLQQIDDLEDEDVE